MLYNGTNPVLQIIGVEHMRWRGGIFDVRPREYSALTFRISGTATITVDGNKYDVNSNDILYIPQNMAYTAEYTDTELLVIHFVTLQNDRELEVYSFQNVEQLYKLFLSVLSLWKNKEPGFHVYALSQLYMILGTIPEKSTQKSMPQHFLNAVSYINANYKSSSLGMDQICCEAGISATTFRQLFRECYKKTPMQYVTDLRLEYARSLITNGVSVETAAYECGYNDAKYFARVVKKQFGCTPRELRNYGK